MKLEDPPQARVFYGNNGLFQAKNNLEHGGCMRYDLSCDKVAGTDGHVTEHSVFVFYLGNFQARLCAKCLTKLKNDAIKGLIGDK